jgi:hypothetical protein
MLLLSHRRAIRQSLAHVIKLVEQYFMRCLQPAKPTLLLGTLADMTRTKAELIA